MNQIEDERSISLDVFKSYFKNRKRIGMIKINLLSAYRSILSQGLIH